VSVAGRCFGEKGLVRQAGNMGIDLLGFDSGVVDVDILVTVPVSFSVHPDIAAPSELDGIAKGST